MRYLRKLMLYFVLIVFSLIYIEPILYIISTAFKTFSDLCDPTAKWIPKEGTLINFQFALEELKIIPKFTKDKTLWQSLCGSPMILSLMTAIPAALVQTITCSLVGYGFAKLKVPFKPALLVLLIFNYIVPPQATFIPMAWVFKNLHLINSPLAFIVPALFANGLKSSIFILIYMQFFRKIPNELEEAALIDGAGYFRLFRKVMFPLAKSARATVFLFSLVWHWNETYLAKVLYPGYHTMSTVISVIRDDSDFAYFAGSSYNIMQIKMASCLMLIAPVLIVYLFTQKQFTESIERTGIVG